MSHAAKGGGARAVADVEQGVILAKVEIAAAPERVYRALTDGTEIPRWWGSEQTYRTTSYSADLRVGGAWRAEGLGADGVAFSVEGEYLQLDPPRTLVQTWKPAWDGGNTTKLTYRLEPSALGTLLTLRHEGFGDREQSCRSHGEGWERVLDWLRGYVAPPTAATESHFVCRLLPPRPTFPFDMSESERALMQAHVGYWLQHLNEGRVAVFGPVGDPNGVWGLGVVRAADLDAVRAFEAGDPVIQAQCGFRYEILPMLNAIVP